MTEKDRGWQGSMAREGDAMFPVYCGAMGFAGWLVMLLVWAALVGLVVWGIARLFPDRPRVGGSADARGRNVEDSPSEPVDSARH